MLKEIEIQILDFIEEYKENRGYAPTIREIVDGTSITSTSVATHRLNNLENNGFLKRDRNIARSICLLEKWTESRCGIY